MRRVLLDRVEAEVVAKEVARFREAFQRLYYCFETGLPPGQGGSP